ncbi:MAG: 2-oxoglutarate dehydrogenase, subunit, partial [Pseudonocardiales bacterium]|nr:2-oxoglutarate dehydrogenase, subunit [Pseudonocardiales bacterium]
MATTTESTDSNPTSARAEDFGANEWLIEEMYARYQVDKSSVDPAWHEFFADYTPTNPVATIVEPTTAPASATNGNGANGSGANSASNGHAAPATAAAAVIAPEAAEPAAVAAPAAPAPAAVAPAPPAPAPKPAAASAPPVPVTSTADLIAIDAETTQLRGAAARVVTNMESSLAIPTATSVRAIPAKALIDNRTVINSALRRSRGGKISFTHIIGYAVVRAAAEIPAMNRSFTVVEGKPTVVDPGNVNLGLAIDLTNKDGSRALVVAAIKMAEQMDFAQFWGAYEDVVRKARTNTLTPSDFAGTTISLTNPGGIGTVHSVPRLMQNQGAIIGVGAMEYPAQFAGMSEENLASLAVGKIMNVTSTYDHRIIQGAQSGEFLRRIEQLLLGEDGFYDAIFESLRIPYEPVRWFTDREFSHEGQIDKSARVIELINAYRTSGHLMADTDPLEFHVRTHPDLDITKHGLTLWDLDREFPVGGFGGKKLMKLRDVLGLLRDAYCRRTGVEYMYITDPAQREWLQERLEVAAEPLPREEQKHILGRLNVAEAFENFLQTKYVGQKRFSLEGGETVIPMLDAILQKAAEQGLDEVAIGMPHRGRLNVLANIVGKPYAKIFNEFEGNMDPVSAQGSGDVKYHLGSHGTFTALTGAQIEVSLCANPSHLEAVDPVLEGIVRAKQDIVDKGEDGFTILPVMMHGDAAFAGQGVVAETLNLSQLRGYRTGGTIHL